VAKVTSQKINLEILKKNLKYDPDTGKWTWIAHRCGVTLGMNAGWVHTKRGRIKVEINGRGYYSSILAWFYMTGEWPALEVDHINRDPGDDRWVNLRLITHSNNCVNKDYLTYSRRKHNLPRGVSKGKDGKFRSLIRINGVLRHLGVFNCPNEAYQAYLKASEFRREYLPK